MTPDEDTEEYTEQENAWGLLFDRIEDVLRQFGTEDHFGDADYLVVDDNYGWRRHTIEVRRLPMLRPAIVSAIQLLLSEFPDWEIIISVSVPGRESWPPMGLTVRKHEIIDGLQRSYLPAEFQQIKYSGSRPGTGYD